MSTYCDSSAVVKLYADEPGADEIRALRDDLLVSLLAAVEVPAALSRKRRLGELDEPFTRVLLHEFEADFFRTADEEPRFAVVAVAEEIVVLAARLAADHGLRAYDAVQLSTALTARDVLDDPVGFACFDADLREAAAAEGLAVLP